MNGYTYYSLKDMADGRESWIKRLHLPVSELAILASQVNRICALEPGQFVPGTHLSDVRDIIRHLDPYLTVQGSVHIRVVDGGDDPSRPQRGFRAQSNIGGLFSFYENRKEPREVTRLGHRDGIGIGSYIAEKVKNRRRISTLSFTPFLDIDLASLDVESVRPYRRIMYRNETLEPVEITKEVPQVRFGFWVTYKSLPIWQTK